MQHSTLRWVQGPTNIYTRESRAQSVLQHLKGEFRAELEEKQHIIAALNTKVGPGANKYIHQGVQGSKCTPALGGRVQGRAGGEAAHHCST